MTISILGIDIGKNSCSVVGVDDKGAVTTRRTMRRETLIDFVSKMMTCLIAMEASTAEQNQATRARLGARRYDRWPV